jgi:hypothetical protein
VAQAERIEGTVVALDGGRKGTAHPVVEFTTADGEVVRFRGTWGSNPPSFHVGERVGVRYRPGDAPGARIDTFWQLWGLATFLALFALPFAGIGVGLRLFARHRAKLRQWLRHQGRPLSMEVAEVFVDRSLRVNQRHPWRILARRVDTTTGEEQEFISEPLWQDPTPHLDRASLTVYIDPRNPRRHWVDVSFLPEFARTARDD